MKKLLKALLLGGFVSALAATTALGQPFPGAIWDIDENGPAILHGPIVGFVNGFLKPDPISGITTLFYPLPGPSLPGDVLLREPGTPLNTFSDLLRFDGNGGLYFFSDREPNDPNPDLADVFGLPPRQNPFVVLLETGVEGGIQGALYTPLPGQPGYDISGVLPDVTYNFISDVPEPTSLALFGFGSLLAIMRLRRVRD